MSTGSSTDHEKRDLERSSSSEEEPPKLFRDEGDDIERDGVQPLSRVSTEMSIESRQEQDIITRIITGGTSRSRGPIPSMGGGKDYPPLLPDRDPYRVDFDGPGDPTHPHNWPLKRKLIIGGCLGFTTLTVAWGSAVFASAVPFICEQFHVGEVVGILTISLYVLGFASGPVIWAPLSELYGRKMPVVVSMFGFTIFSFGTATAKDLQTIMLCRFFAGFIGAGPLAVVAAAFADMFNNETRGSAIIIFSVMVFCGPILAPVVGGFIANSYLGWRWTEYITGIMGALAVILDIFFYHESYHPIILLRKAREIRQRTGNWGVYAPHELVEFDVSDLVQKNLSRPLIMLFTEPILFLITIYTAFIYGLLYLFLEAYPIVFGEAYQFKKGKIELPYIGLLLGMVIAAVVTLFVFEPRYVKKVKANNWKPVPEARLVPMVVGGIAFPIGIFWFTWSGNYPDKVHWAVPTVSGLFSGYGLLSIFLPSMNYIIDSYLMFAASAIAGNSFLRSSFGAAFPLFATAMFHNLGINWAGTVLGCIAVALIPIPFLFMKYGKRIRQRSKFAFDLE